MQKQLEIYIKNGIRVFPVATNAKIPAQGVKWKEDATYDTSVIEQHIAAYPGLNWGAVIDEGYVVIDIDAVGSSHAHDGIDTFNHLIEKYGMPPRTLTVATPSGGIHLYFRCNNKNIPKSSANINGLMGIDIKSNGGGYVVAAGSKIDGNYYEVMNKDTPIADLPEWLEKLIEKPKPEVKKKAKPLLPRSTKLKTSIAGNDIEEQIQEALELLDVSDFDGNYDSWLKVGMSIHSSLPDSTGKDLWDNWSQSGSSYDKAAIESSWNSFKSDGDITIGTLFHMAGYSPKGNKFSSSGIVFIPDMEMNDAGLGKLLMNRYGHQLKYISELKSWIVWDEQNSIWLQKNDALKQLGIWHEQVINEQVIDTSCISADDKDVKKQADRQNSWLSNQLNQNKLSNVRQYYSEKSAISVTALDQNRRLLGVENGVIELGYNGGTNFRQQTPNDLVTKSMRVAYDKHATCPKFKVFLDQAMQGDQYKINYFQVWLGYCLTGEVNEPVINFLHGSGKNGKSVFTDTIIDLFGDYAIKINSETFMKNKMGVTSNAAMSDLAQMHGARLVISDEVPTDASFNTKVVKSIVGESIITAKFMHQNTFNYKSTAKFLLYGNNRPFGDYGDDGFWRRMKLIGFNYVVPNHLVNKTLLNELKQEFAGILNWALEGYIMWASNSNGLVVPDVIESSSSAYRKSLDTVAQYLDYQLNVGGITKTNNDSHHIVLPDMMKDYKTYCEEQSFKTTHNPSRFRDAIDRYFKEDSSVGFKRVARGTAVTGLVETNRQKQAPATVANMSEHLAGLRRVN